MKVPGYCRVCEKKVDFSLNYLYAEACSDVKNARPNWREHLCCPSCHLNNRMRYMVGKIKDIYKKGDKVYIYEQVTAMYAKLKEYIPDLVGSEYIDSNLTSGQVVNNILHEDAMKLSFSDEEFDLIISQDVMEHVADYEKAFKEMYRVLKQGGKAIITVPFDTSRETIERRAILEEGEIKYLMPPQYHGNPMSSEGSLVFQIYSWDLFSYLKQLGFKDAYACTYYSIDNGNMGMLPFYIIAEK